MDDDFNYIRDQGTISRLGRRDFLRSTLVFLPIGRNNHWSMSTADMSTNKIYHEDPISGTHSNEGKDDATILKLLLKDMAKHTGAEFNAIKWTCYSSRHNKLPQQNGIIDCGVFTYAYTNYGNKT